VAGADLYFRQNQSDMTYLALARKWRPKTFDDVVGQGHVVRALENALNSDRVHHAYLFAGTRGVGKTTIARILAKALNCDKGVTAEPCGTCNACLGVDEGRFIDLIEVDAASRTGVDDTRELLENVQYTPSSGRFKVYLIDEVHMLSRQSFNALLKTLEEPPPHVKFLFATTDPQKLPVTVLSRCLQFNLKRLSATQIVGRMTDICAAEKLQADTGALARLGRAATGSMRDGLSLLDQAIAFGDGQISDADAAEMLGSMDQHRIVELLDGVIQGDGAELLRRIRSLDELVPDYERVMDEMATVLQRIAVIQVAGVEALEEEDDLEALVRLAAEVNPEFIQLLYQISVTGRRDLSLAPDNRLGFEMAMLRMLTFRPQVTDSANSTNPGPASKRPVAEKRTQSPAAGPSRSKKKKSSAPAPAEARAGPVSADEIDDWLAFIAELPLEGAARQLAENTALEEGSPFELRLSIERRNEHLLTEQLKERMVSAVQERVGEGVNLRFTLRDATIETVAARSAEQAEKKLEDTEKAIQQDPTVQDLVDVFGAEIVPDSVRPGPDQP
jgi:DNA polymerase-3 subunit gamma/tau